MKNTGIEYQSHEQTPTILSSFSELLPPLTDEQLSLLEEDILKNGCYAPIIVNEDFVIVDGHNRYSICEKHGLPYRLAVFSFEDDLEAKQWALDTQKSRRNLTLNELCKIAMKLRPEIEARAKENMASGGGDKRSEFVGSGSATLPNPISNIDTRKELAKSVGVGERTMGKAMKIEDEAPKAIKDAVDSGDISINQGYNLTRELEDMNIPEDEQEAAAMEAVEREILRKQENKKRKVDEKTRIAKLFCAAFENSVLLKPTVENVETWIERSGILPHQLEGMVRDAEEIAESYLQIAEIIKNTIKNRDRRNEDGSEKEEQVSDSGEDGDIDDLAEELSDIIGEDD
jgi:hypothetical protein